MSRRDDRMTLAFDDFASDVAGHIRRGIYDGCHPGDIDWATDVARGKVTPQEVRRLRATADPRRPRVPEGGVR
jgi:hypothetical protein